MQNYRFHYMIIADQMPWNGMTENGEKIPVGPFNVPTGTFGTEEFVDFDASANFFFFGRGTSSAIGRREPGGVQCTLVHTKTRAIPT